MNKVERNLCPIYEHKAFNFHQNNLVSFYYYYYYYYYYYHIIIIIIILLLFVGGETVNLVYWPLVGLLYQPLIVDKYGAVGKMRIGEANWSTLRKSAPLPLCLPQIPHDLTWAAEVGNRRPGTWTMA
jgi:hypothetical protein